MKFLLTEHPTGTYTDAAGRRFDIQALAVSVQASGPLVHVADSASALSLKLSLTALPAVPAAPRIITTRDFLARIPDAVYARIKAVARANAAFGKQYDRLLAGREVHSDNPDLIAGIALLTEAKVLTAEESAQLLAF